ncbi:Dynamitin-domain-containing protein [Infundibulicybe gibba]|nr:Dynamitin-domain-containing protein [Infundibulicybe gibba]
MSNNKYADLPDIDTAPDIYETEDVFPTSNTMKGDSSDDEAPRVNPKLPAAAGKDELDSSSLAQPEEARKKFKRAEKRRERTRHHYTYPPSPSSPSSPTDLSAATKPVPLSQRLRALHQELSALEVELADPSNPLLQKEDEDNVDPGELIRDLVDVRTRLDKIRKGKEGRGRLVGVVLGDGEEPKQQDSGTAVKENVVSEEKGRKSEMRSIIDMDKRVQDLEKLVGSSNAGLDESSPLPPPLLPLITRLNNQLTILTQPRHIDSISRRLKLLVTDLDRASASQHHSHRRHPSQSTAPASQIQEQILPLLSRLAPSLPHIPHILTRLRTLAALHTSASEFQSTLKGLEDEQQKTRQTLNELDEAIQTVEKSLEDNRTVVRGNVGGLESRVDQLLNRLEEISRNGGDSDSEG